MNQQTWTAVDDYLTSAVVRPDPVFGEILARSAGAGLPPISVSAPQGRLLQLLARSINAARILEIGTLGGYSTAWLASALPRGGRVITLEYSPEHAVVARANLDLAGLSEVVEVIVGPALDTLPRLVAHTFDLVFIDADKPGNPDYFQWAVRLSRPGTLIVVDNVVRDGAVADSDTEDPMVLGARRLNEVIAADSRVSATTIQTVGVKGYDGFTLAYVDQPGGQPPVNGS